MINRLINKIINRLYGEIHLRLYTVEEKIRANGGIVGEHVFIGKGVLIDYDFAFLLEIGRGAVISARTIIELHDSSLPNVLGHGPNRIGPVVIAERAYIGVNSVILPGTHVGAGAIVGACSLVNRDIPAGEVWAGTPATRIGTVAGLLEKRNRDSNPRAGQFDWMGEPEKVAIDYPAAKAGLLEKVRKHFQR